MNVSNLLTKKELKEMADIMSESFIEHENWTYLIGPKKRRKRALYHIFIMMYKVINQYGLITTITKDDLPIGYITFMDDSDTAQISFWRVLKTGGLLDFLLFLLGLNFKEIKGIVSYMRAYSKVRHLHKEHTMHLYMVGILKEYRGNGYLSLAFKELVQVFKEDGIEYIILETSDKTNIPIYKKMKFTLESFIETKKKDQKIFFFQLEL